MVDLAKKVEETATREAEVDKLHLEWSKTDVIQRAKAPDALATANADVLAMTLEALNNIITDSKTIYPHH